MPPPDHYHNPTDEALLVRKVLHGDANAYTTIVEQHQKLVVSIVNRMVQQNEDREDLYQEIFLKVYEKLGTFRFQSKLSTWIANIAFNHSANFLKRRRSVLLDDVYPAHAGNEENVAAGAHEVSGSEPDPGQKMLNRELGMYLMKSMDGLSVLQRTIIQLFHQHEFSLDEIAVITNLPVNTVKSHLFRGRAIIKTQMLKYLNH